MRVRRHSIFLQKTEREYDSVTSILRSKHNRSIIVSSFKSSRKICTDWCALVVPSSPDSRPRRRHLAEPLDASAIISDSVKQKVICKINQKMVGTESLPMVVGPALAVAPTRHPPEGPLPHPRASQNNTLAPTRPLCRSHWLPRPCLGTGRAAADRPHLREMAGRVAPRQSCGNC